MSKQPQLAMTWLSALGAGLQRKYETLGWSAKVVHGRIEIALGLDQHSVTLRVGTPSEPEAWVRSASFCISIVSEYDHSVAPTLDAFLRVLAKTISHTDPGGLQLPAIEHGSRGSTPPTPSSYQNLRAQLGEELNRAAFLATRVSFFGLHRGPEKDLLEPAPLEDIVDSWRETLAAMDRGEAPRDLGLYVHVPFCSVACTFCHCSMTDSFARDVYDAYPGALLAECDRFAPLFQGRGLDTVNFGGGTPSLLSAAALAVLFDGLYARLQITDDSQVTFEAHPRSLTDEKIEVLAHHGHVNRLSIGVQSFDELVQRVTRRHNGVDDVRRCIEAARRHCIEIVNIDLIAGLPEQTWESLERDIELSLEMEPDRIHLVGFRVDPWTPYVQLGGRFTNAQAQQRGEMLRRGHELLAARGCATNRVPSPTANRQLDSHERGGSVIGLGFPSGSHAFGSYYYCIYDPGQDMTDSLAAYVAGDISYVGERSSRADEARRFLVGKLRSGFNVAAFRSTFGCEPGEVATRWNDLVDAGVIDIGDGVATLGKASTSEYLTFRALLYGQELEQRIMARWGSEYDRDTSYIDRLRLRYP